MYKVKINTKNHLVIVNNVLFPALFKFYELYFD